MIKQKSAFKLSRYDLSLNQSTNAKLLAVTVSAMVFLGVLFLLVFMSVQTATQSWTKSLSHRLTIEIIPAENESMEALDQKIKAIIMAAETHPAVATAELIPLSQLDETLKPWFGRNLSSLDIPLPRLIDVTLKESESDIAVSKEQIKFLLQDKTPYARIDSHEGWTDTVIALAGIIKTFSSLMMAVILFTVMIIIVGVTRGRLDVHKPEIEIIALTGAHDEYIIRQFEHYTLISTIKGALVGTLMALLVIMSIYFFTQSENNILSFGAFKSTVDWLIILCAPMITVTLVSLMTARITLTPALRGLF